jgi:hypothetical protein
MERGMEVLPAEKMPFEYFDTHFIEAFFETGMNEKGAEIVRKMADDAIFDMQYYIKIESKAKNAAEQDKQLCMATLQWLNEVARRYGETELSTEISKKFEEMYTQYIQSSTR